VIQKFVDRFDSKRATLLAKYSAAHPSGYDEIVADVVRAIADSNEYETPDADRIVKIDHGDYQGTLLFVIGASGYQPSTYWAVKVGYGSCSGCDTFQSICSYTGGTPSADQANDYMTLALHVVQGISKIGGAA
jgi:hypothetical protein